MHIKLIKVNSVVMSLSGHDKGGVFAVLSVENENYTFIADGRHRKIQKPKKKKTKHLKLLGKLCFNERPDNANITNKTLYQMLRDFKSEKAANDGKIAPYNEGGM